MLNEQKEQKFEFNMFKKKKKKWNLATNFGTYSMSIAIPVRTLRKSCDIRFCLLKLCSI